MKTIGAKELRQHLDKVLDQVLGGQDIIVSHRFKGPVRMSAVHDPLEDQSEKMSGLKVFDAAPKRPNPFDRQKDLKHLYKESIAKKHAD